MEYTTLGPTGLEVSKLCLGTWRFGEVTDGTEETTRAEAHDLLDVAHDEGINFIDTADRYGDPPGTAEEYLGDWLADHDREEFVLASKVGIQYRDRPNHGGLSRTHVRRQIDGTLERLGTDYVDLYYVHRLDGRTPIAEVVRTLNALVDEGKVNYLGVSTMAAWELATFLWRADAADLEAPVVTQPPVDATLQNWKRYDRFDLHRYLEVCADADLGVVPYSPLAGGLLTGKYDRGGDAPSEARASLVPDDFRRKYLSETAWDVVDAVEGVAADVGATPAQVALRWVMDQTVGAGPMIPLMGARTPDQLRDNVGAVDLDLAEEHLDRIDDARGEPLLP